jgi:hypothetical protein
VSDNATLIFSFLNSINTTNVIRVKLFNKQQTKVSSVVCVEMEKSLRSRDNSKPADYAGDVNPKIS